MARLGQITQTRLFDPIQTTDEIHNTAMFSDVSKSRQPNPTHATTKISQIMEVMIENAIRHFTPELFSLFILIASPYSHTRKSCAYNS